MLHLDPGREAQATDLTLRDAAGHWWRPQRDGSWLRHDGEGWMPGAPPDGLEGVAPLPVGVGAVQPRSGEEPAAAAPQEVLAPDGLRRGIERIRDAYRSGEMVSTMAELLLADWMLLTPDGRLWTVGAQSQAWHAYGTQGWERQPEPPAGPFLSGEGARAVSGVIGSPARSWAERGPYLPEAVAPPWEPPAPPGAMSGATSRPAVGEVPAAAPQPVLAPAAGPLLPPPPPVAAAGKAPLLPKAPAPKAGGGAERPPFGRAGLVLVVAALAVVVSAFLPWRAGGWPSPFRVSATFLWDVEAELGGFSIGLVAVLLGLAALATLVVDRLGRYRRVAGGLVCGVAALWLIETLRYFWGYAYLGWGFLGDVFAAGPWLALAAGLVLLLKRR
jgi:hypothetical protein